VARAVARMMTICRRIVLGSVMKLWLRYPQFSATGLDTRNDLYRGAHSDLNKSGEVRRAERRIHQRIQSVGSRHSSNVRPALNQTTEDDTPEI
jgi:hypothetical protein